MRFFKKLFGAKKIPYVGTGIFRMSLLLKSVEEGHKKELLQQKLITDEMFQKELKSAYSRGYGDAMAELFGAIQKEPDMYHEFIERHRGAASSLKPTSHIDALAEAHLGKIGETLVNPTLRSTWGV